MKQSSISRKLDDVRKEINARNTGDVAANFSQASGKVEVYSRKIVSEDKSHFILIKGLSKVTESSALDVEKYPGRNRSENDPESGSSSGGKIQNTVTNDSIVNLDSDDDHDTRKKGPLYSSAGKVDAVDLSGDEDIAEKQTFAANESEVTGIETESQQNAQKKFVKPSDLQQASETGRKQDQNVVDLTTSQECDNERAVYFMEKREGSDFIPARGFMHESDDGKVDTELTDSGKYSMEMNRKQVEGSLVNEKHKDDSVLSSNIEMDIDDSIPWLMEQAEPSSQLKRKLPEREESSLPEKKSKPATDSNNVAVITLDEDEDATATDDDDDDNEEEDFIEVSSSPPQAQSNEDNFPACVLTQSTDDGAKASETPLDEDVGCSGSPVKVPNLARHFAELAEQNFGSKTDKESVKQQLEMPKITEVRSGHNLVKLLP